MVHFTMIMTPWLRRTVLAVALLAPACAASSSDDAIANDETLTGTTLVRPVQMNDVSVLFPLAGKTQADIDASYLAATDLLPQALFDLANSQTAGPRAAPSYDALRLVAFRFDPCFANIGPVTDPSRCLNQLRLVFQVVEPNTTSHPTASADDGAFHVFFSLTRAQLLAALDEMTALRVANAPSAAADLGPLAVHPIVKKQGMTGAMAKGLNAIVKKYADPKNVAKVTSFHGVFAQGTSWLFDQVDVTNGKGTLTNVPTVDPAGTLETLRLGTAAEGLLSLSTAGSTAKDGNRLLISPPQLETSSDADRQAAYDAAARVENPNFHSPNTIDCTSCHTAQISRQLIGETHFKIASAGNANLFVADPSIPAADLALTVPVKMPDGLSLNLHAFSYDGTEPTIITRVVNETASNIAYLNGLH